MSSAETKIKGTEKSGKVRMEGTLSPVTYVILIILPIAAAFLALGIGRMWISPCEVFEAVMSRFSDSYQVSDNVYKVIWTIRMPRIILALFVGAGLSVSGCVFQSLFSNPLATPDTLGVASGASFGAALAILLGFKLLGLQIFSFLMGALAVALTFMTGFGKGRGMNTVVLAGIMIGSLFSALVSLVKFSSDTETQLPNIEYFLMGSLNGIGVKSLTLGGGIILAGLIVILLLRYRLNILPLSDDEAKTMGVNLKALRIVTVVCATGMTASSVAMCGQVGWVGLLVPHMCRMKWGSNHLSLIPASISVGAVFMVAVDTFARSARASEIPISILTAIIGAPFFIMLLRKTMGRQF